MAAKKQKITKRARRMSDAKPAAKKPSQTARSPKTITQPPRVIAPKQSRSENEPHGAFDTQRFSENMGRAAEIWQTIMSSMRMPEMDQQSLTMDATQLQEAWTHAINSMIKNPTHWMETQCDMMQDYWNFWQNISNRAMGETCEPYIAPDKRDKRFMDSAWGENLFYDAIKESYLMANKWMAEGLNLTDMKDSHTRRKIDFFSRQFMDALSPSNYLFTNPQAMKELLESNGENLVHGLQHLLEDIERGDGNLRIRMTDESAFEVGKNLATSKGSVVYQNELIQLIQYEPVTKKVHQTPLLIMPAWINKYYIFDLQEKNSFVKWATEQGHTVFVISWVNPDETLSGKDFSDYLKEGPLAALDAIEKATGEKEVNAIGYCLGGTLLAITLAYLKAKGEESRIKSATYLTTLVDYSEVGDLSVFIDDSCLSAIEDRMSAHGFMPAEDMSQTFNMLRSNDLIWSFYINNYLMGKTPFPFDILYWNSDSTRLPLEMNRFYLRNFYQKNLLVKPEGVEINGVKINLRNIETPAYVLSTKDDHIAPWKSTYLTGQTFSGPVTFTLAESGHVAGVISPPSKQKYGYYAADDMADTAEDWMESAHYTKESWWLHWNKWAQQYTGKMVPARKVGGEKLKALEAAPGSYVKV